MAMCGIAVAVGWDDATATVRGLIGGVLHRGDVTDPVFNPSPTLAMGTRRLRIVDGGHAIQPQLSFDGRIAVSFNGEIYNHDALRVELEALGVPFRTRSDTEVLANALGVWGPAALTRLNGMFALVAVDVASGAFLAARDPLGVKPLYLIQSGQAFVFCSEIRPLLETVETGDVLLLPPGHLLTADRCVRYKRFTADPAAPKRAHDPRALDALLAAAVHRRLPPGLPVAAMFSGGIDSTLVVHYARQLRPATPGYFLGGPTAPDYPFAARYADAAKLDLRQVALDNATPTLGLIDRMVEMVETFEPSVLRDSFCTALIAAQMSRDGYRVALCGEGADELFAGYLPLEVAFDDGEAAGTFVRDQCLGDMHRTNLQRLDRAAMHCQLEAREPFLDPTVVDYALSLAAGDHVRPVDGQAQGKAALRSLYDLYPKQLPIEIRDRRKLPLNEGAGLDPAHNDSPWIAFANDIVTDAAFLDGQARFKAFDLRTKEELLYLDRLAMTMDVSRVPHLTARARLQFPTVKNMEVLRSYMM
jgi:asparagine synthase (glutamine-hydrolysing)